MSEANARPSAPDLEAFDLEKELESWNWARAAGVSAQAWHPKQRARTEKDGSYVLEIPYANDRELLMEILKFGADVEVLAPASLRDRVAAALGEALTRYAGS